MADINLTPGESAGTRFTKAKQDFASLLAALGPQYDGLIPAQRQTQIDNLADYANLNDAQKHNALAFALALMAIGVDFLARKE